MDNSYFLKRQLTTSELKQYHDQGYLAVGRTLTDDGLDAMREQAMTAWTEEKGPFDPNNTWLKNALLPNIHHRSELIREFYFDGPLVDFATQIIGPNIKGATSQLTFKMRGNTKPFAWHQDNGYGELDPYNSLTCLTALDDADETNGCLWIVPCSHRQGQIDVHELADPAKKKAGVEIAVEADESKAIAAPLRAGESLIFHCHMLHKSDGNHAKDRDRRILFVRYADADAVEVYNERKPRLGRLLRGQTKFEEVRAFEADLSQQQITQTQ